MICNPPLTIERRFAVMVITDQQKNQIYTLRSQGKTYNEISSLIGINAQTIKTFVRRHPNPVDIGVCKYCGKVLPKTFTPRKRIFCSNNCKGMYYQKYCPGKLRVCKGCDKEFHISYKHPEKIFCSEECYRRFRRING